MLVDDFGFPDWWATKWAVEKLRASGQAANTIATKLRAVQCLYLALPIAVELTPRLAKGEWLEVSEVDHLLEQMAYPTQQIKMFWRGTNLPPKKTRVSKVVRLENVRAKLSAVTLETVSTPTKWLRLLFIREFLNWRANEHIVRLRGDRKTALAELTNLTDAYIESRTAHIRSSSSLRSPIGLTQEQQEVLLDVIRPDSPRNPWKNDKFIRVRNQFVVELFLATGPRRGATLGMQSGDLDPITGRITILRRKDDLDDPRPVQTGNKCGDYIIPLGYRLLQVFKQYQIERHKVLVRNQVKTHYLIISNSGRPLEQSSINYILSSLRVVPELAGIKPHLLRHTWASNYVAGRVANGDDLDTIERDLKTLGGWADKSDMPSHYTSLYKDEKAFDSSIQLQAKAVPLTDKIYRKEGQ